MSQTWYAKYGKRVFDMAIAIPLLILCAPLVAAIAAAIRVNSPGPTLFRQARLGRYAEVFEALKFRTMVDRQRVPDTVHFQGDPAEITSVGRFLRRYKLDELPQLINVIRGEMSLVGPRPQLPVQLDELRQDENGRLRLLVRPGLTGLAQTHGNVALTWPERWHYDAEYVRTLSLSLDVRIMARTINVLLRGEDAFLQHPTLSRPDQQS